LLCVGADAFVRLAEPGAKRRGGVSGLSFAPASLVAPDFAIACSARTPGRMRPGLHFLRLFFRGANLCAMAKVNIAQKFSKISEYWKPYIAAELNGQQVKLDKLKGEFVFHHHEHEDELFLVVKGRFRMEFRDDHEWIEEGEFIVVPRGVEHKPVADEECWILLFEPASTLNTGNVVNERTIQELERV
jgi:mannose-6-phosphate isomerase-like protein (cupin superfamily)